jgi:serine/threonine protein kinase
VEEESEARKLAASLLAENLDAVRISNELKEKTSVFSTNLDCYRIIQCIGKGSFGKVHLGEQILTKKPVAIKAIDKSTFMHDERSRKKIENEISLFGLSNGSKRIIRLLEVFENKQYTFFVMEHAFGGDLLNFLKLHGKLKEAEGRQILGDILLGLTHLHSKQIVHRDIKLDNILLDRNGRGK